MRLNILKLGLIVLIVLLHSSAFAERTFKKKVYFTGNIGFNFRPNADTTFSGSGVSGVVTGELDPSPGFVIGGGLGTILTSNLRAEVEIAYRTNDMDPSPGLPGGSDMSALSFMANGYYDFDIKRPIKPYLGAGLGFARTTLDASGSSADDSELVFAYQLMLGISYDVSPITTLTGGYRYFAASDPEFNLSGLRVDTEWDSHEFLVGARFQF